MKKFESVIYIPGLGDRRTMGQKRLIPLLWKLYGFNTEYHPIMWMEEDFEYKLRELGDQIEQLATRGSVSLVGTSAGASAVLNLYANHPQSIHRLVTVCGKIQRADRIKPAVFRENPNFKSSLDLLPASLEKIDANMRQNILCIRPLADPVVPVEDAILPGAYDRTIPTTGHTKSISYALTFGSRIIANFIHENERLLM